MDATLIVVSLQDVWSMAYCQHELSQHFSASYFCHGSRGGAAVCSIMVGLVSLVKAATRCLALFVLDILLLVNLIIVCIG